MYARQRLLYVADTPKCPDFSCKFLIVTSCSGVAGPITRGFRVLPVRVFGCPCPLCPWVECSGCATGFAEDAVWSPITGPCGSTSGCDRESLVLGGLRVTRVRVSVATPSTFIFVTPKDTSGALGELFNTGSVVYVPTACTGSVGDT